MNYLVIYPGRFHPFHLGHKASYDYLVSKYGADAVYIATSDKQAPVSSPFSYSDKVAMMTKLGIPASHVVKVQNPYRATEITDNLSPEQRADTALIFAVSAKDAERFDFKPKKDGSASYMQPLPASVKKLRPMTKAAYIDITPTVNFKVRGQDANSATVVRQLFIDGNDSDRDQIITDLYGAPDSSLRDMFKQRLGITDHVVRMMQECRRIGTARSLALMERIIREERAVLQEFTPSPGFGGDDDDDEPEYPTWLKNKNGESVGSTIHLTTGEWAWDYWKLDQNPRGPFYSFDILGHNFATEREAYASLKAYHASHTAQQLREFAPGNGGDGEPGFARKPQKFKKGDVVWVAKDLGSSMSHFANNCPAIVLYSYESEYGDGNSTVYVDVDLDDPDLSYQDRMYYINDAKEKANRPHDYGLLILAKDDVGETAWYPEDLLAQVPPGTDPVALCSQGNAEPYAKLSAKVKKLLAMSLAQQLREFAHVEPRDDDGDVPPDVYELANRWWNNTDDQDRIAMVLRSMGWDIQQADGEEDVCQLTYRDGSVYYLNDGEFDPELYENSDYIEEKWSQKYKRSIDCSHPRGFSQKAHCAGRKK